MDHSKAIALCIVIAVGFACQWISWRLRVPVILFLLAVGLLVGPTFGWLDPDALLGELLVPLVSVAVAIILFEGSLTLNISEIRGRGSVVRNLVTVGILITWVTGALAAWYVLDWSPYLAILFGAIVTVSGPTVVMPLLRTVRPTSDVASVLRWEAILIDPLGALLSVLVFEFIVASRDHGSLLPLLGTLGTMIGSGTALGAAGGQLLGMALRRRLIPDHLRDYAALAAALTAFALAESIKEETGLLAVTVMGVWLANMRDVELDDVLNFKESLALLLVAALFILLAARLDFDELQAIGLGAITVLALLQFVASPARALICSIGSPLSIRERLLLGWIFPRGIVAAAVAAVFALRLGTLEIEGAERLVPLVFSVILGTVVIQSLSARRLARWLGVAEPPPRGVLIVGANPVARAIAEALHESGVRTLVADSNWADLSKLRMLGIATFYGSAVSSFAEDRLDLTGIGTLLAASQQPGLNELACVQFARDFGSDRVFTIATRTDSRERHRISGGGSGRVLLGGNLAHDDIQDFLRSGGRLERKRLTDEYRYEDYVERNPQNVVICAVSQRGKVAFPVDDQPFEPESEWTLIALDYDRASPDDDAAAAATARSSARASESSTTASATDSSSDSAAGA